MYLYIIHISPKGNITIKTIAVGNIFNYYYYYYYYLFYNNDKMYQFFYKLQVMKSVY